MSITYTIKGKTDGFGAQYQAIMSGIAYCNHNDYIYVHTPISKLEHDTDVGKANEFIGIDTSLLHSYDSIKIKKEYESNVHYCKTPSIYYNSKVLEYIRNSYYSTKKPEIDPIDIAIHIRRGDVSKVKNKNRYTDNDYYIKLIEKLKNRYPIFTITVFSEGEYKDFNNLGLEESCFRLSADIFETFHSLVCSKILIQSFSSFSYCAGIINHNVVYHYDNFHHKKLDHWLSLGSL